MSAVTFALVVPTIGRASLGDLLRSVAEAEGPLPTQVVVVDDRPRDGSSPDGSPPDGSCPDGSCPDGEPAALPPPPARLAGVVTVRSSGGRGPAAARNVGWRATAAGVAWVVFLDDDVVVGDGWLAEVAADLGGQPGTVGGVLGRISVPLPVHRRPTDWERSTHGLQTSAWITADMAYRRAALCRVGGFDERFRRAYREDSDMALRVRAAGYRLVRGSRQARHPVRPADRWVSVRMQAGNADDVLMRRLHGPDWRHLAAAPRGRRRVHLAVTASAGAAVAAALAGRRRLALLGAAGWALGTGRFAWSRIAPGPRTAGEVAGMLVTSLVIPPAATWHWVRGEWRHRHVSTADTRAASATNAGTATRAGTAVRAVLFDRDGTLIHDVPYNGDPDRVRPVDGAVDVVRGLRARGLPVGVVTNQSGVGRGRLTVEDVRRVNARVEELFGAFDVWAVCPHAPEDRCRCRKPAPGMVLDAAGRLGLPPEQVALIGDVGADVEAARAAGALGVLVPTEVTRAEEVRAAPLLAPSLAAAVALVVGEPTW